MGELDEGAKMILAIALAHQETFDSINETMKGFGYKDGSISCGCLSCRFVAETPAAQELLNIVKARREARDGTATNAKAITPSRDHAKHAPVVQDDHPAGGDN